MVHNDEDFLRIWVEYYGQLFGKASLYVVNHGGGDTIRQIAKGANLIEIPNDFHRKFDAKRWRLLNHLVQGLRIYHDVVIVGDVDEIVISDPASGTLHEQLQRLPKVPVVTPFGLELVHRPDKEPLPLGTPILQRRSHVRIAPLYAKPCIVKGDVRLSRGGHYATCETLTLPHGLYLLHLKHCDRDLYQSTTTRRNNVAAATGVARPSQAMIGRHWFSEARDDAATFAEIDEAPIRDSFEMTSFVEQMDKSWRPRGSTGFWEFKLSPDQVLYNLPGRFKNIL